MSIASTPGGAERDSAQDAPAGQRFLRDVLHATADELTGRHSLPGEARALARMLVRQADALDSLDRRMRDLATQAVDRLRPLTEGDQASVQPFGVLTGLGADLETLGAAFYQAHTTLSDTASAYRHAARSDPTSTPAATAARRTFTASGPTAHAPQAVSGTAPQSPSRPARSR